MYLNILCISRSISISNQLLSAHKKIEIFIYCVSHCLVSNNYITIMMLNKFLIPTIFISGSGFIYWIMSMELFTKKNFHVQIHHDKLISLTYNVGQKKMINWCDNYLSLINRLYWLNKFYRINALDINIDAVDKSRTNLSTMFERLAQTFGNPGGKMPICLKFTLSIYTTSKNDFNHLSVVNNFNCVRYTTAFFIIDRNNGATKIKMSNAEKFNDHSVALKNFVCSAPDRYNNKLFISGPGFNTTNINEIYTYFDKCKAGVTIRDVTYTKYN
jgi:hypothetical protein